MSNISRRQFVMLMSTAAAGTAMAPMGLLQARKAMAKGSGANCNTASFSVDGFGPISAKLPENTLELPDDLRNTALLELPDNFAYTAISIKGQKMSDGLTVPGDHDGMACFQGRRGNYILVRNHELNPNEEGKFPFNAPNGKQYDSFPGGGTSTVVVDRNGRLVEDYISLAGTIRNCAGGPAYWGSWISCEENVTVPDPTDPDNVATKKHGYNFEVPSLLGEAVDPIPLVAMGRMNHEAVSVDPQSGYVYETEDRGDSAYYKFVPKKKPNGFGDLQKGGDLYAMIIEPGQRSKCTGELLPTNTFEGTEVVDTRGLDREAPGSMLPFLGQPLKVKWVKLEDVDPEEDTLRLEAQAKGAAVFWRGEGAWYDRGKHYWVCSGAGDAGEGQVWCYDPKTETATMIVESTDEDLLDGPDNMTVARDGTIYLCEDGSSGEIGAPNYSQRVVGVDASGGLFDFAKNIIPGNTSEFAGACFSQDAKFMYVNSQGRGITYCIWRTDYRPIYLKAGFNDSFPAEDSRGKKPYRGREYR
ncbi:alkaline phosphatase PhoX [Calothrix sp. CCY 0018]|uniref:alkaline phosphatase PhoX n=1 Tax=Calothrix sp. CCY 0018 TaxID=3103864 RepID=UPI0039C664B2